MKGLHSVSSTSGAGDGQLVQEFDPLEVMVQKVWSKSTLFGIVDSFAWIASGK